MKQILIVEDDNFLANAYRIKFEKEGFKVLMANDGEQALSILEQTQPDVILLDLVMPKVDGFTVLSKIKANNKFTKIKTYVASNLGTDEDRNKAMKLGAEGYIVKTDTSIAEIVRMVS